jgi:hypothetical protein
VKVFKPNFDQLVLDGSTMTVTGESDPDSEGNLPLDVHVFVEQEGHVAHGPLDKPNTGWTASLTVAPGEFTVGHQALAYGVEIRTQPFLTTTWSQLVEITAPKA